MKILIKQDVNNWKHDIICKTCESFLEIEPNDISYSFFDGGMREPSQDIYTVTCPVCSHKIGVDCKYIPKILEIVLKKKSQK